MASDREETQRRRRQLQEQLQALSGERLMRGSIVERRRRCGRPNCACARDLKAWHKGKVLTVHLAGRTHALHLRPEEEARVQEAITAYGRVWEIINGLTGCELRDLRREGRERRRARRRAGR
jgi:hypothetical protein